MLEYTEKAAKCSGDNIYIKTTLCGGNNNKDLESRECCNCDSNDLEMHPYFWKCDSNTCGHEVCHVCF
jgi:hypothetical protein